MYSPPKSALDDTELTLGLPGRPRRRPNVLQQEVLTGDNESEESEVTSIRKSPVSKIGAVGWPPLRSYRKKVLRSCVYVKVAVDGAPYLRKVDLDVYSSYKELMRALEEMFSSFAIHCNSVNKDNLVPTYEDKDGDWMLVGDVPWGMFKESCKRIRLMKSSESLLNSAAEE